MISSKANKTIQDLIDQIAKNGLEVEKLIEQLKELREMASLEKDPLLKRAIRLTYEHLEENDDFELSCIASEEDEEVMDEDATPEENLSYMLQLWIQSENKYNRDEIRTFADQLTEMM